MKDNTLKDKTMPELSVIIPVYKVEEYLRRCIDSVLKQTFPDYEIILVDDGSPDACPQICDEYAANDPRIRVIHQQNGGLSAARNAGLKVARGEYIYFIDSDDYIEEGLFSAAVEAMGDCDLVTINCRLVDEDGSESGMLCFSPSTIDISDDAERFRFLSVDYFEFRVGFGAWLHFYRKSIIDKYDLFFEDNKVIFAEDLYFTFCYLLHADLIKCIPGIYYNYLQRSESIMGKQHSNYNFGRMNELSKAVKKHITKCGDLEMFKKNYPVIHYQIISNVLQRAEKNEPDLSAVDIRRVLKREISDIGFFYNESIGLKDCFSVLRDMIGRLPALKLCCLFKYYATGDLYSLLKTKALGMLIKAKQLKG